MIFMCTNTGCGFDGHAHQPAVCPSCKADLERIEVPSGDEMARLLNEAMQTHGLTAALAATLLVRHKPDPQSLLDLARHSIADSVMLAFVAERAIARRMAN